MVESQRDDTRARIGGRVVDERLREVIEADLTASSELPDDASARARRPAAATPRSFEPKPRASYLHALCGQSITVVKDWLAASHAAAEVQDDLRAHLAAPCRRRHAHQPGTMVPHKRHARHCHLPHCSRRS